MFDSMELVAIKKLGGKVTQPIDPEFLPPGYGGGGVSSWNDIPDRPFYSEEGEVAILPETTVEFDPDSGEGAIANVVPVVVGNTYKVYWNGTAYPCIAGSFDMDGVPLATVGNLGALTGEGGTDEPFVFLALPPDIAAQMGAGGSFMALDGSTSATVSITEQGEIVHGMEGKYLPEGTPYIEETDDVIAENMTFSENGFSDDTVGQLVEGNIYRVNISGVVYECQAFSGSTCYCLGNSRLVGIDSAFFEDVPFGIKIFKPGFSENGYTAYMRLDAGNTADVSVSIVRVGIPHKIDKRLVDVSEAIVVDFIGNLHRTSMSSDKAASLVIQGKILFARYFVDKANPAFKFFTCAGYSGGSLDFTRIDSSLIGIEKLSWDTTSGTFTVTTKSLATT